MASGIKTRGRIELRPDVYLDFDDALETFALVVRGNEVLSGTATAASFNTALATIADLVVSDVADIALSTANTYTDAAVNTAVNAAIAEINTAKSNIVAKMNVVLARLEAAGISEAV